MHHYTVTTINRRKFLRNATAGAAGVTLLQALPSSEAAASSWPEWYSQSTEALRRNQAEREVVEEFSRAWYAAADNLDINAWMAPFAPNAINQDAVIGDVSFNGFSVNGPNCGMEGAESVRSAFGALYQYIGMILGPGKLFKYTHAAGSLNYGVAIDFTDLPGTFYVNGVDLIAYNVMENGKVVRRNDYYDTAQLTPADHARLHPGGVPRLSCVPGTVPNDLNHASPEMVQLTHAFHEALRSGRAGRVANFFTEDALLIHPLLHVGSGPYGLFNRGIQVRGRKAIARFFKAALPVLPDGPHSAITHMVGGPTGGGYEWRATGIYANQGIARNGIHGVTSISLFGNRILRMCVKFDTLQMTAEQREAIRRAVAAAALTVV